MNLTSVYVVEDATTENINKLARVFNQEMDDVVSKLTQFIWYVHWSNGKFILDVETDEKLFDMRYRNYNVYTLSTEEILEKF